MQPRPHFCPSYIIAWYQARWTIEQVFRVMKSPAFQGQAQGLQIEDSQLASADRLVKLAAVAIKKPERRRWVRGCAPVKESRAGEAALR